MLYCTGANSEGVVLLRLTLLRNFTILFAALKPGMGSINGMY